ncbi:hypothetical protein KKF91_12965 [Myxococcota bacterium]|nr:hypothetical protein [Myxococcota bacterium]MBU1431446.1 hypothetical protein [Myxococcota bacterium]MBU1896410.1 hypothetical protein [Myxococcota bacterium]
MANNSRMSRRQSRRKAARKQQREGAPRRSRRPDPIRSMLLGAALIGLICAFFIIPIGGATGFTHVIHGIQSLVGDDADEAQPKADTKAPKGRAALPHVEPARA